MTGGPVQHKAALAPLAPETIDHRLTEAQCQEVRARAAKIYQSVTADWLLREIEPQIEGLALMYGVGSALAYFADVSARANAAPGAPTAEARVLALGQAITDAGMDHLRRMAGEGAGAVRRAFE